MIGHLIPAYVALSVLVAICVLRTALSLAARVGAPGRRSRGLWLIGGAVVMGCGVWAIPTLR